MTLWLLGSWLAASVDGAKELTGGAGNEDPISVGPVRPIEA